MKETLRTPERPLKILSFGTIEDLVEELKDHPPDAGVVRVDSCLEESKSDKSGLGVRIASVLVTASRKEELLVANLITTYVQTVNGRVWREEEAALADENNQEARRIIEEQFREAGLALRPGAYAVPHDLILYRATSQRIGFEDRKVTARKEGCQGAKGD